jgi:hypothetical protein
MARAVAHEAEYQRKEAARLWLGKELPDWPAPCEVRFTPTAPGTGPTSGVSTFTFGPPGVLTAGMEFRGGFVETLTTAVPHEVTHAVIATHFRKQVPRWTDEGIALTAEPDADQARHDELCRKLLAEGRGVRLRVLFRMTDYPQDVMALYAQGHSVVRFLLTRQARTEGGRVGAVDPVSGRVTRNEKVVQLGDQRTTPEGWWVQVTTSFDPNNPHSALLGFITVGLSENTAGSWDKAAREVYGFESVDALEEAWLEWLKKPESRLKAKPAGSQPAAPRDEKPDLIPPVVLPGAAPPAPPASDPLTIPPPNIPPTAKQ